MSKPTSSIMRNADGELYKYDFVRAGLDRAFPTVGAAFDGKGAQQKVFVRVLVNGAAVGDFEVKSP